ncbi:hypothetical protein DY138_02780 [Apilactobacillus timberlakei]|uniref:hypothetical protein n=1 Tax=Apilactobacillus timberlakei TaxID=2008380 RepID=UPI00112B1D28|nr:hypothetical protein [Apilactobacillus timberlakei]TPR19586.1 hypothetical protein DY138_02780 [Apilactobacillus timberlakei]TPR20563.1 hypothetical protein DY061_04420 [Apilactobacillus timberlakei]TPR22607.1 hypothetical protein DY083_03690 [Apilactobacillus timberlakei]
MRKNNSLSIRLIAFFISLLINALGNVFTIYSNLGSSIWTTAAVNLNDIFKGPLSIYILAFGIFNIIVNQILIGHLDYIRALGEFAYTLLFSYLIDFFPDYLLNLD